MEIWIPVIVALVSSFLTYLTARTQNKKDLQVLEKERKADLEKLNLQHKHEMEKMQIELEKADKEHGRELEKMREEVNSQFNMNENEAMMGFVTEMMNSPQVGDAMMKQVMKDVFKS